MKLIQAILVLLAVARVSGSAWGDEPKATPAQQEKRFEKEITITVQMNYLVFLPQGYEKAGGPWPLILFLHGGGETGSDLARVKVHGPPKIVETKKDFPFVVVSPQSPRRGWNVPALNALLDEVLAKYKVDEDRVYLTGLSMGGAGTWALAAAHPERFGAIVPICGSGNPGDARRLRPLPTWAFHGAKDPAPVERSESMVKAIKAAGGNAQLTVYPEAGHDAWTQTYDNPEVYAWLLKQKRRQSQWAGTWQSTDSGPGGELRCVARQIDEQSWQAHFTGFCERQFAYEVEMRGKKDGDAVRFEGQANLGEKDGGVFKWTGRIEGDTFRGQYTSSGGKKGEFRMSRMPRK